MSRVIWGTLGIIAVANAVVYSQVPISGALTSGEPTDREVIPSSCVWGRVTDERGEIVPDAHVTLWVSGLGEEEVVATASTDGHGLYSIESFRESLPPRYCRIPHLISRSAFDYPKLRLGIEHASYGSMSHDLSFASDNPRHRVDLQFAGVSEERRRPSSRSRSRGTQTLRGIPISFLSHEPQPNLTVWLSDGEDQRDFAQTLTDADGQFIFEDMPRLPSATYRSFTVPDRWMTFGRASMRDESDEEWLFEIPERVPVSGTVCEAETGHPVADTRIRLWTIDERVASEAQTDSQGRFQIDDLLIGASHTAQSSDRSHALTMHIAFPETPWCSLSDSQLITVEDVAELRDLEFAVHRGRFFEARAVDPEGNPLAGAQVYLLRCRSGRFSTGVTDESGWVRLLRPPWCRESLLVGSHARWPLLISEPIMPDSDTAIAVALETCALEIQVVDNEGRPCPGTMVWARPPDDATRTFASEGTRTDEQGRAIFPHLPRTEILLDARREDSGNGIWLGQMHLDLTATVSPSQITVPVMSSSSRTAAVAGRVVGCDSEPIPGALVCATTRTNPLSLRTQAEVTSRELLKLARARESSEPIHCLTDESGRFEISCPRPDQTIGICVLADGYWLRTKFFNRDLNPEQTFTLTPITRVSWELENVPVLELPRVSCTLLIPNDWHLGARWMGMCSLEDLRLQRGSDQVDPMIFLSCSMVPPLMKTAIRPRRVQEPHLPPWFPSNAFGGDVRAVFSHPELGVALVEFHLGTEPGQEINLGQISLQPGHTLHGRVLNTAGEPASGATVRVEIPDPQMSTHDRGNWQRLWSDGSWNQTTGANGEFALTRLPPGLWDISVECRGLHSMAASVEINGDVEHDFTLAEAPCQTVNVHIISPEGDPMPGAVVWLRDWSESTAPLRTRSSFPIQAGARVTNDDGVARFQEVPPGWYSLSTGSQSLASDWFTRQSVTVGDRSETVTIDLSTWPRLSGRITEAGNPLGGYLALNTPDHRTHVRQRLERDGRFGFSLPQGRYQVSFSRQEESGAQITEVTITDDLDLHLDVPQGCW